VNNANNKLMNFSDVCKAPENKFITFYTTKNKACSYKYVFRTISNLSTKF